MKRIVAALAIACLTACGASDDDITSAANAKIRTLDAGLPSRLGGLDVRGEDLAERLSAARPSYVEAIGLYSLRSDDLLHATLQVSRFRPEASYRSASFRRSIADRIGASAPRAFRLGGDTVYLSTGTKQRIAVWFRGRHGFVLAVREDYASWRTLLRQALELEP